MLDENLTLVDGSGLLGSRCSNHSLTVGVKDGVLNVFIYSLSMTTIAGNTGEVACFKLKLGNQPATISLTPSKAVLTNAAGTTMEATSEAGSVTIRCAKAQYSTMEVDFGEVPIRDTYTRTVTVTNVGNADLAITGLNYSDNNIFSTTTELPLTVGAGASNDINITYKPVERGSINKTLKVECNSVSKLNTITLKAQPFAVNELHIQNVSGISDEEVTISMTMNNMDAISGYQVEFEMPEQLSYVDGSFELSARKQDHQAVTSLNGKTLRIIVYSPTDKPLTGNDGEIGTFKVKLMGRYGTTLTPTKTVLSATINNKLENVVSAVYGGQVTINSPSISCSNVLDFGAVPVTEACEKHFSISNYGSAPLTISRIVFSNENLSVKESLPLVIPTGNASNITVVYNSTEQKPFEATMQIYNNDPDMRLQEVSVSGSRFAPNYMTVDVGDVFSNENLSIDISLNTYDAIKGLQFDVVYPGNYYRTFDGNYTLEARAEGMSVSVREIDENTLRYFCYFLSGSGIAAGEGKIMTLLLNPSSQGVPAGIYSVRLQNIMFGTGELSDKYTGTDAQCSYTVKGNASLFVKAKSYTRVYGEANPTFEFESGGSINGTPEMFCNATALSPVGEYPIIVKTGSITTEGVAYANGVLTITKAPLSVKAGTYTKKQGEDNPEFTLTYEGWKSNDTEAVLTKKPIATTTATKESVPGEYTVTVSEGEAQNYELSYINGKLIVTQADPVTITAKSYTRVYGDTNPTFEYTSEGATLVGTPEISCEATTTSPVGTYDIVVKQGDVKNYNVTYLQGTLTITKAPLAIKAGTYTKKQGEDNPEFTLTYEGWKNNETEAVLTKRPTATTTATKESEPGEYEVTVSGGEVQNYELSYQNGKLIVTKADPVTITAKSYTRVYGDANPTFEYTSEGATLVGTPEITCEALASSPVGTYDIIVKQGSVKNYNVTYVKGTLTIIKAPLAVKAGTYTKKQGEDNPEFSLAYEGWKNNETEAVLTKRPTATTTATKESEPGEYEVTVSGGEVQNYELSYQNGKLIVTKADPVTITAKSYTRVYGDANPTFEYTSEGATLVGTPEITCEALASSPVGTYDIIVKQGSVKNYNVTYVKGTLTIIKAPLAVKAGTYTKKQGEDNPEFTLTDEGWKNNETEAVLTKKPTATTTATKESAPGEYEITVSGGEATNYELSYINGKLIVTQADAVVIAAKSYTRVYGDANPTFEYEVSGAALEGTPEITCEATATSPVGTYPIVIKKGSVANYNDTYVNGTLTITKAPLAVKVENATREQYVENPEFVITYTGWKLNDDESVLAKKPTATTTATKDSPVGEYEILVSGGEAKNYDLNYENGILTVIESTGIATISVTNPVNVYNVQGRMVCAKATTLSGLPSGVYIVNGKKVVVK